MLEPLENTSEQDEEFRLLQSQYVAAAKRALHATMTVGLSSTDFRDAEKEAALATLRIEEILARSSTRAWIDASGRPAIESTA